MIIVQLIGGLGNQMFQYALGRYLAFLNDVEFKLDISGYEKHKLRKYILNHFNIIENIATKDDINHIIGNNIVTKIAIRFIEKLKPYHKRIIVREKINSFDPNIFQIKNEVYLQGYWQSEKYFKNIEDIIRKEFTLKHPLQRENNKIANDIINTTSISLHIRRGDYVSNPVTSQIHGICSIDYYKQSISLISEKTNNPHFYIFSDDMDWVKANLVIEYPVTYIDHNGSDKDYVDVILMSLCKHNIIANSSFSWWGTWLNSNPRKIVIGPKKWFNDLTISTNDLIPDTWITI